MPPKSPIEMTVVEIRQEVKAILFRGYLRYRFGYPSFERPCESEKRLAIENVPS